MCVAIYRVYRGSTLTLGYGVDETHGRAGLDTGLRSLDCDHVVFVSVRHSGFAVCQLPGHFDRGDAVIAGGQILALDKWFCRAQSHNKTHTNARAHTHTHTQQKLQNSAYTNAAC